MGAPPPGERVVLAAERLQAHTVPRVVRVLLARERRVRARARRRVRGATRETALPTRLLVFVGPGDDSTPRARARRVLLLRRRLARRSFSRRVVVRGHRGHTAETHAPRHARQLPFRPPPRGHPKLDGAGAGDGRNRAIAVPSGENARRRRACTPRLENHEKIAFFGDCLAYVRRAHGIAHLLQPLAEHGKHRRGGVRHGLHPRHVQARDV